MFVTIKKNKVFFILLAGFMLVIGSILLLTPKNDLHLFLNQFHTPFFDIFFRIVTFGGDGVFPFIIAAIFLVVSYRKAIFIALAPSIAGLLSQFFKRVVFPDVLRPKGVFGENGGLYFVPGVDLHSMHSFPSGHTTTIFSLALCLVFFSKQNYLKILWFFIACTVAYSRVYLSQHFLIDVYFGAILGTFTIMLLYYFYSKINYKPFDNSLIDLLK